MADNILDASIQSELGVPSGPGGELRVRAADALLLKYDAAGNPVWVRQFNPAPGDRTQALGAAVDASGAVYVVGSTDGVFPGQPFRDGVDAFVRKVDGVPSASSASCR